MPKEIKAQGHKAHANEGSKEIQETEAMKWENVSKTAVKWSVQGALGLGILFGIDPETAQELAADVGLTLQQAFGGFLLLTSAVDAWFRKITEKPMQPGVGGLWLKRE